MISKSIGLFSVGFFAGFVFTEILIQLKISPGEQAKLRRTVQSNKPGIDDDPATSTGNHTGG